jgi:uncharacterized membrane protein (UPF0127 family)
MSFKWLRSKILMMILVGLIVVVSGEAEPTQGADGAQTQLSSMPVTLGAKTLTAFVANEDWSRTEGLLKWNAINEEQGMLLDFVFPAKYAIHMEGMKFPIDALWIDAHGAIKLIYEDVSPNSGQIYPSLFPCRYCLELKAGFCKKYGIKMGQTVVFGSTAKP